MAKNCNECLHNPICQMWRDQECQDASSFQLSGCGHFKDRSRFVELPCKVGGTVWDKKAEPWNIISVEWFSKKVTHLHCVSPITGRRQTFSVGKRSVGKTVFLSREEAEKTATE